MSQIATKESLLTPEQYAKGLELELTSADFRNEYDELDAEAFFEAQANFSYLNMETFMDVENRWGEVVPYRLNRPQKYLMKCKLEQLERYGYCRLIVLKTRQVGSSTFWARDCLIQSKLRNFKGAIVAHAKASTGEKSLFKYATDGYDKWCDYEGAGVLPVGFTDVNYKTKEYLEFANGGNLQVYKGDIDAVGSTNQYIHISEASRIHGYADFMESIMPSLPKGNHSTLVIESTARYTGGYFFQRWWEHWEEEKQKGYPPVLRAIFIPCFMLEEYLEQPLPEIIQTNGSSRTYDWNDFWKERRDLQDRNIDPTYLYGDEQKLVKCKWYDPLLDEKIELPLNFWYWRRLTIDEQEVEAGAGFTKLDWFRQNYPMTPEEAELIAGDSVFPRERIRSLKFATEDSLFKGDIEYDAELGKSILKPNKMRFVYQEWDEPMPGLPYVIALDPANQREGDWAVAKVFSPEQKSFPAMLRVNGMVTLHEIVCKLVAMGYRWNNAMIGWEANLVEISDTILAKMTGQDPHNPPGTPYKPIYTRMRAEDKRNRDKKRKSKNPKYGFWTSNNKGTIIQLWMDAIYDPDFELYSTDLMDELWFMRQVADKDGFKKNPNAPKGKNDDIIMAGGIAMFIGNELNHRPDLRRQISSAKISTSELAKAKYEQSIEEHIKSLSGDRGRTKWYCDEPQHDRVRRW